MNQLLALPEVYGGFGKKKDKTKFIQDYIGLLKYYELINVDTSNDSNILSP